MIDSEGEFLGVRDVTEGPKIDIPAKVIDGGPGPGPGSVHDHRVDARKAGARDAWAKATAHIAETITAKDREIEALTATIVGLREEIAMHIQVEPAYMTDLAQQLADKIPGVG